MPTDNEILKETEQKIKHRYKDVNKNDIKDRGTIPVDIKHENHRQMMQMLITE